MQKWKMVVLCGLTVGTSFICCRPQIEQQFNPRVNTTGSKMSLKIPATVVSVGSFLILHFCLLGLEPGELALCDCEFATGPPDGLSCDKEGWFISNFERQGSWVGEVTVNNILQPAITAQLPAACSLCLSIALHTLEAFAPHAAVGRRRGGSLVQSKVLQAMPSIRTAQLSWAARPTPQAPGSGHCINWLSPIHRTRQRGAKMRASRQQLCDRIHRSNQGVECSKLLLPSWYSGVLHSISVAEHWRRMGAGAL